MGQQEKNVGAVDLIRIGTLEITITPLSQGEELALDRQLRRAAEAAAGDHYTRCRPILDAMRDAPGDRIEAVREITRMAGRKEPLSGGAFFDFRTSAAGLPLELYARGKKATPGLELAALEAIVTEVNADEIGAALLTLIQGDEDNKS